MSISGPTASPDPLTPWQALTDILLALLLTIVGGLAAAGLGGLLADRFEFPMLVILLTQGLIFLVGLQLMLRWRGQRWRQLGLVPLKLQDLGRALVALLLVFLTNAIFISLVFWFDPEQIEGHERSLTDIAGQLAPDLSLPLIGLMMLFVGLYEEVLARGFLLQRARRLFGGTWGPVLLSSILFGLGHIYQGWVGTLQTTLMGIVLSCLALRWQTLWPGILAHALINTASFGLVREFGNAL